MVIFVIYYIGDNMQIIYALLISTLAGISTVVGGLIVFLDIKDTSKFITYSLSFTATIMIGISLFELFPESFITLLNKYNFISIFILIIVLFGVGKGVIYVIDKMINNSNNLYKIGILNMLVLILHNFPEGITTFLTSIHDINIGIKISITIMLHNIPEGIAIAAPVYITTNNKKKAIFKTFISGLSEPIGALFAYIILKDYINEYIISFLVLVVCSIMISLSIEKILPEAARYKREYIKYGFILGIIILIILLYIL